MLIIATPLKSYKIKTEAFTSVFRTQMYQRLNLHTINFNFSFTIRCRDVGPVDMTASILFVQNNKIKVLTVKVILKSVNK